MDGGVVDLPSEESFEARIHEELAKGWQLWVLLEDEGVQGILAIVPAQNWVDQLFVLPSCQGKGYGSALVAQAKRRMPMGFTLRTLASNRAAQKFYQTHDLHVLRNDFHPRVRKPIRYLQWTP